MNKSDRSKALLHPKLPQPRNKLKKKLAYRNATNFAKKRKEIKK